MTRVHVVCPTTPLTRQWAEAAGRLGVQLAPDADELHPPRDFDGIVATYARVAPSAKRWASQCGERTLVIADECHHMGDELAWGEGFTRAFAATDALAAAVGHAVSLRPVRDRRRAVRRRRRRAGRQLQLRRGRARRHLPPGRVHPLRRHAVVAVRRRRHRVLLRRRADDARGEPPLPHRDLDRARRRAAADPARRAREASRRSAAAGTATRAGSSSPPTAATRGASPRRSRRSPASRPSSSSTPTRAPRRSCARSATAASAGSSR